MKKILIAIAILTLAGSGAYFYKKKSAENGVKYSDFTAALQEVSESVDTTGTGDAASRRS